MNNESNQEDLEFYDIPPPNHSDYVALFGPLTCWALATFMAWDEGAIEALFNGSYYALGSLAIIVLAQFLLRDPPSVLFRDSRGRIFDTLFGLWSDRDPARCAAEDAVYEFIEEKIKEERRMKNKN